MPTAATKRKTKTAEQIFTANKLTWLERITRDQRLKPLQARVVTLISFYMNWKSGDAFPSQRELAAELGVTIRSVQLASEAVEGLGYLRIEVGNGPGNTNKYFPIFERNGEQPFVLSERNERKWRTPAHEMANSGAGNGEQPFVQNTYLTPEEHEREDSRSRSVDEREDGPETNRETVIGDRKSDRARSADRKAEFPDGFVLNDKLVTIAAEKGFNSDRAKKMFERFEGNHRAKGSRFADWSYAWRNWVVDQVEIDAKSNTRAETDRNYIDGRL